MSISLSKYVFLSWIMILACSASSQAETITYNVTASGGAYFIDGDSRAALELTVGNTYVFTGFPSYHPLRFSTTDNGSWGGGVNYQDNVTSTSSSISIVVTEDTPNLFYYCQNHSGMGAAMTIATPPINDNVITYSVTAAGGAYFIDGVSRAELNFIPGKTYVFDGFPSGHPLLLSTTADGTHNGGVSFVDGVTISANRLEIVVTDQTPALYYYCQYHQGMGASISLELPEVNVPAMGLGGMMFMGLLLTAMVRRANQRIT